MIVKDLFASWNMKGYQMPKQFLTARRTLFTAGALRKSKFEIPERFAPKPVVFNIFRDLVNEHKAIDLGEGYPDYPPPKKLSTAVVNAATSKDYKLHHYAGRTGHRRLLDAVSKYYSKVAGYTLDPTNDVIITVGATQALYIAFQTNTNPGDEWILFEPFYSYYASFIRAAQGVCKFVALRNTGRCGTAADWVFDKDELACAFNEKTKGVVINSPHNPLGKVFSREELEMVACLAKNADTLVISDESYEFLTYDQVEFTRIATLPDMFERTITISSSSKAFRATGYRVGWAYGCHKILNNLKPLLETNILCVTTPLQEALSTMLEDETNQCGDSNSSYLMRYRQELEDKRNFMVDAFNKVGLESIVPQGGYFVVADSTKFQESLPSNCKDDKDEFWFVKWMIKELKILGLPLTGFCSDANKHLGGNQLRFTMCKKDETLKLVSDKLSKWTSKPKK